MPLRSVNLRIKLVNGSVKVGIISKLPVQGIQLLLGNDLAKNSVVPDPILVSEPLNPVIVASNNEEQFSVFPACAVTRAQKSTE